VLLYVIKGSKCGIVLSLLKGGTQGGMTGLITRTVDQDTSKGVFKASSKAYYHYPCIERPRKTTANVKVRLNKCLSLVIEKERVIVCFYCNQNMLRNTQLLLKTWAEGVDDTFLLLFSVIDKRCFINFKRKSCFLTSYYTFRFIHNESIFKYMMRMKILWQNKNTNIGWL